MTKERVYEVYVSKKLFKQHHVWALNQEDARRKISYLVEGTAIELINSLTSQRAGEAKIESARRDDTYLGVENSVREANPKDAVARHARNSSNELHTVKTSNFAAYIGEQIAWLKGSCLVTDVFCGLMREHKAVSSTVSLVVWSEMVRMLLAADSCLDSEEAMAGRAVATVLRSFLGDELTLTGFPIQD